MNIVLPPWDTADTRQAKRDACPHEASILGFFFRVGFRVLAKRDPKLAKDLEHSMRRPVYIPFLSYSMLDFMLILEELGKLTTPDDAAAEVAGAMLTPFFGSPVGALMFTLAHASPHELISASVAGYRGCVSWGTRTYTKTDAREALMKYENDLLGPAWHAVGIFPQALQSACGITATVDVCDVDEARMNFTLRTRW